MLLNTVTQGSGELKVGLIHGASGDLTSYHDLTDRLVAGGATVNAVDLRGHGESPHAESYTLSEFAADVIETLPAGLDVVMGHSLGALVLLEAVAALAPERAVYLDPPFLQLSKELAASVRATFDDDAVRAGVGEHPDGTPFSPEELAAANPGWGAANVARAVAAHRRWDNSMVFTLVGIVFAPRDAAVPQPVPSLILMGGDSPFHAAVPQDAMVEAGYEVRVQAGVGHNLFLDDVDGTMAALEGWVKA